MTGLKPNLWTLLLVVLLAVAGVLFANGTLVLKRDGGASHAFSDYPGKLRVLLVTDTSQEERDLFFRLINGFTMIEHFDTSDRPTTPDQADVVVFVLRGWADVDRLPFQDAFAPGYDRVRAASADTDKIVIDTVVDEARDLQLVFYNLAAFEEPTWRCLAADFVSLYLPWDERITDSVQSCLEATRAAS